jgi:PEP-CTERM motif
MRLTKYKIAGIFLFLIILGLIGAPHARADTVYTYTGNPLTIILGPSYKPTDFIRGSFTLASALGNNFPLGPITPTSYSFTDGVQTLTNKNSIINTIEMATNSNGTPDEWVVGFCTDNTCVQQIFTITQTPLPTSPEDRAELSTFPNIDEARNMDSQGSWSITVTTPEPGTLSLLGLGTVGLGLCWWMTRKREARGQLSAT